MVYVNTKSQAGILFNIIHLENACEQSLKVLKRSESGPPAGAKPRETGIFHFLLTDFLKNGFSCLLYSSVPIIPRTTLPSFCHKLRSHVLP